MPKHIAEPVRNTKSFEESCLGRVLQCQLDHLQGGADMFATLTPVLLEEMGAKSA